MPSNVKAESVFDVEKILQKFNLAFLNAATDLRQTFEKPEWRDAPYIYSMPKMHVSMRVSLSYREGKVKAFFFKRSEESKENELVSTIDVDIVAVPRSPSDQVPMRVEDRITPGEDVEPENGGGESREAKGGEKAKDEPESDPRHRDWKPGEEEQYNKPG